MNGCPCAAGPESDTAGRTEPGLQGLLAIRQIGHAATIGEVRLAIEKGVFPKEDPLAHSCIDPGLECPEKRHIGLVVAKHATTEIGSEAHFRAEVVGQA